MNDKLYMKRVLIPLWVIQLLVLLIFTGISGLALYGTAELDLGNNVETVVNVYAALLLAFSVFTIILDIVEIILAASHRLGPVAHVVFQCIKTVIWTAFFIKEIQAVVAVHGSGLSIFLVLVLFLTCVAQLIYGSVVLHRHRKGTLQRGKYSLAEGGNAHSTAYTSPYNAPPAPGGSYAAYQPSSVPHPPADPFRNHPPAPPYSAETAYKPAGAAGDYNSGSAPQNTYEMHGGQHRY